MGMAGAPLVSRSRHIAHAAEAAQVHHPSSHCEDHIAHCLVLTSRCCCSSRSQPCNVLLLLPLLLLLAASLMRLPAVVFLLLAETLHGVTADICVDDMVYDCLHRRQHCLLCSLPASCRCVDAGR